MKNTYDFKSEITNPLLKKVAYEVSKEKCLEDKEKVYAIYLNEII